MFGDTLAQMVLGDDVDGELSLLYLNIGVTACRFEQAAFDFLAGVVLVVENAEFGVAALAVQVETEFGVRGLWAGVGDTVEVDAVLHQLAYAVGCFADGHLYHLAVADAVAGNESVLDVLVERVTVVHHGSYSALRIARRAFGGIAFGEYAHLAIGCHLEGKAEAGNTGTYH